MMRSERLRRGGRLALAAVALAALLAGCGSTPRSGGGSGSGGGYYKDDGPGSSPPANLDQVPDALPAVEPLASGANRPYVIFGKRYVPDTSGQSYRERGTASWYGRKFHGARTSNGEIYDMYGMTAAHPTLPIPSYARVTRTSTGKSVLVRVNDRGPFHDNRLIDLSYTAAYKLGILGPGSAEVVVEKLLPDEIARIRAERSGDQAVAAASTLLVPQSAGEVAASEAASSALPAASAIPVVADSPMPQMRELAPLAAQNPPLPAAATTAPPPPNTPYVAASSNGIFLQLGAFGAQRNAQDMLARARAQLGDWTEPLRIVDADNLHRVHVGPYASRESAMAAARLLQERTGIAPVIVTR